jgi:hypothetical protein
VLTPGTVPIAKLVPYQSGAQKHRFGALRSQVAVRPEFSEPLPDDEIAARGQQGLCLSLDMHAFRWWIPGDAAFSYHAGRPSPTLAFQRRFSPGDRHKSPLGKVALRARRRVLEDKGFVNLPISLGHRQATPSGIHSIACSSIRPCWMA